MSRKNREMFDEEGNIRPPVKKALSISGTLSEKNQKLAIHYQFVYSMVGLGVGLLCLLLGIVLFLRGISGTTSLTTKILNLEGEISDAAPGGLLFFVGIVIIYITRFSIKER